MASSQVMRSYAPSARRRRGDKSRSGCSATSRNRVPLAQTNPWLTGCARSGRRRTGWPDASRSASKPHAASQMRQNVGTEHSGVWCRVMNRECTMLTVALPGAPDPNPLPEGEGTEPSGGLRRVLLAQFLLPPQVVYRIGPVAVSTHGEHIGGRTHDT